MRTGQQERKLREAAGRRGGRTVVGGIEEGEWAGWGRVEKVGKHPDRSPARRPAAVVTTTGVSQTSWSPKGPWALPRSWLCAGNPDLGQEGLGWAGWDLRWTRLGTEGWCPIE